jgi:hypothetical protein
MVEERMTREDTPTELAFTAWPESRSEACPSSFTLDQLFFHELAPSEAARLSRHVEGCPRCKVEMAWREEQEQIFLAKQAQRAARRRAVWPRIRRRLTAVAAWPGPKAWVEMMVGVLQRPSFSVAIVVIVGLVLFSAW